MTEDIKLAKPFGYINEIAGTPKQYILLKDILAERKEFQKRINELDRSVDIWRGISEALTTQNEDNFNRAEKAEALQLSTQKKYEIAVSLIKEVMHYLTNKETIRVEPFSTEWEKLRDAK